MAYRNGFAQLFKGSTNIANILASSSEISSWPKAAVSEKNEIGAQQAKSVNTSNAIRLATRVSLEFQACEPRIEQYIFTWQVTIIRKAMQFMSMMKQT